MIYDWLVVGFVFACLWIFWLWLTALFDWITNYQHPIHSSPDTRREDAQARKGKVPSSS